MSDATTCSYCGCTLTMGRYEFTGHTDELCKALTLDRIRFTERALENAKNDLAILRDMMGRHVCASEPAPPAGDEVREAAKQALGVLTDLAESAAYWSEYDVPLGIVSRVDFAKARLAAALAAKGGA